MKFKAIFFMVAALGCSSIITNAQTQDESRIKLLKTDKPGVVKLIHALDTNEPVTVKFINEDGIVGLDRIKGIFPKGVGRLYNLNNIYDKNFTIEISSANMKVTYQITPSKDRKTFTSHLEKVERSYTDLVASRN
jgi:hypothetical protein